MKNLKAYYRRETCTQDMYKNVYWEKKKKAFVEALV